MMDLLSVTALFADLQAVELRLWIERGWVQPESTGADWEFHAIDVARVRLLHDLRRDMDVGEDAIPVILSLLDQVYELRSTLKTVLSVLQTQPRDVQSAVLTALEGNLTRP